MESTLRELVDVVASDVFEDTSSSVTARAVQYRPTVQRTKLVFVDSSDDEGDVPTSPRVVVATVSSEYDLEMDEEELRGSECSNEENTATAVGEFIEDVERCTPTTSVLMATVGGTVTPIAPDAQLRHPLDPPRRELSAVNAVSSRKRYREDGEGVSSPAAAEECATDGIVADDCVPCVALPVEGTEVLVKAVDGYRLTLREEDVQDVFSDDGNDADEEEGDEEDDELDDLVIVSAVEQMLRCCQSELEEDDLLQSSTARALADTESAETPPAPPSSGIPRLCYQKFIEKASAQLQRLYSKEQTIHEFAEVMEPEVFHLQRVLRRSNKPPRDAPIVIDGVVMDM